MWYGLLQISQVLLCGVKKVFIVKGSDRDIEFLKIKIKLYIVNEEYEKAAELKRWVIEMGGDPEIENVEMLIEDRNRRNEE